DQDVVILEDHKRQVTCVAFSPDGKHLVTGSQDKTLKIWDLAKRKVVKTLEGHTNWLSALAFVGDGVVASTSDDLTVRLWDVKAGKALGQIDLSTCGDCPRSLAAVPGSRGEFIVGTSGWVLLRCRR